MHPERLLSHYLKDVLEARKLTPEELSVLLGYVRPTIVIRWIEGKSLPAIHQLPDIAKALQLNPADLVIGWVMEGCPALEMPLRTGVLENIASAYPLSKEYRAHLDVHGLGRHSG